MSAPGRSYGRTVNLILVAVLLAGLAVAASAPTIQAAPSGAVTATIADVNPLVLTPSLPAETDLFGIGLRPALDPIALTILRFVFMGLISLSIVVSLLVALVGSLALNDQLKRRLKGVFPVEIWNDGNLRNRYNLRAETAPDALSLEFQLQGSPLPVQSLAGSAPQPDVLPKPVTAPAPAKPARPEGVSIGAVKETGAYQSYQKATGLAATVADFLNTIASLLPRGAAAPLRNIALNLREGERFGREVNRVDRRVKVVQHATSDVGTSLGGGAAQPGAPAPLAPAPPAPAAPATVERPSSAELWALTPYVEAGEKLSLQLCARPLNSMGTQTYQIRIVSHLVDVPDLAPVTEAGNITVTGLSRFQRLQPYLLALIMLTVAAVLAGLLALFWGG